MNASVTAMGLLKLLLLPLLLVISLIGVDGRHPSATGVPPAAVWLDNGQ